MKKDKKRKKDKRILGGGGGMTAGYKYRGDDGVDEEKERRDDGAG